MDLVHFSIRRSRPHLDAQFMVAFRFLLSGSNLFIRRELSSDRRVFRSTIFFRLNCALFYVPTRRVRGFLLFLQWKYDNFGVKVVFRRHFTFRFRAQESDHLMRVSWYAGVVFHRPLPRLVLFQWRCQE